MDQSRVGDDVEALLLTTMRDRLAESGGLNKIKSELRAMVLNDIRGGDNSSLNSATTNNPTTPTQIANHLVKEYIQWMGFQFSAEMFATESGCKDETPADLKTTMKDADGELPLLLNSVMKNMKDSSKD